MPCTTITGGDKGGTSGNENLFFLSRPGGSSVASSERALINAFRNLSNMADRWWNYQIKMLTWSQDQFAEDDLGQSQLAVQEGQRWGEVEGKAQWGSHRCLPLHILQVDHSLRSVINDHSTNLHLRQEGVPRTFKEIVAVSTVNKRDIGRCFKIILKWHEDTKVGLVDSGDFMSR